MLATGVGDAGAISWTLATAGISLDDDGGAGIEGARVLDERKNRRRVSEVGSS